jgi:three-Cys-motif partner protein
MSPEATRWPIDEHTRGKHIVLGEYLKAWFPILATTSDRCLFIDGFAGPGRYAGGEPGSPLIALGVFLTHVALPRFRAQVNFIFIEARADRAIALEAEVGTIRPNLPPTSQCVVVTERFDVYVAGILDRLQEDGRSLAPAFVMVDPFGVRGAPLAILARLLQNQRCELYISVMGSFINRFRNTPEFEPVLTELYGDDSWRGVVDLPDGTARIRAFLDLYEIKLRSVGGTFVLRIDLYRANAFVYSIFFVTKNRTGCSRMKDAIWKISPGGEYEFRGVRTDQLALSLAGPNFHELARLILQRISILGAQEVGELEEWLDGDETVFRNAHLRTALKQLEADALIAVDRGDRRRGSYPAQAIVSIPPRI